MLCFSFFLILASRGFSSPRTSPFAFLSSLAALRRAITAALSRSAYSQPAGERSESALYECSMRDCPDCVRVSCSLGWGGETYTRKVNVSRAGVDIHQEEAASRLKVSFKSCKYTSVVRRLCNPPSIRFTSILSPTFITLIKGPSSAVTVSYTSVWSRIRSQ